MEDLGKSFSPAEGFIEAESNTRRPHPNEFCLNCGTKLLDVYCHHCGQKDLPRRQGLGDLLSNFIASFTNYEGKFLQTAKYLFLKPGLIAVEYNNGRREHYFHPVRMYVFVSAIFFLLFFYLPEKKAEPKPIDETPKKRDELKFDFKKPQYNSLAQYDSAQNALPEDKRDNWLESRIQKRAIELQKKYANDPDAMGKEFLSSFTDNFSTVLFYLMPLMALVLKLLYIRRDYFYAEHLAVTICYYNFFYLAGSAIMILNLLPAGIGAFTAVLISLWIYFYLLFAMKRVYGQRWGKTILKFVLFTGLFSILVLIGVTINGLVSLMVI